MRAPVRLEAVRPPSLYALTPMPDCGLLSPRLEGSRTTKCPVILSARKAGARLGAPIVILDADDIVLAEIAAGLHFDQLEQDLARVFEAVHGAG